MSSLNAVAASNLDSNYRGVHVLRYSSICRQVIYKHASINLLNKVDNSGLCIWSPIATAWLCRSRWDECSTLLDRLQIEEAVWNLCNP